MPEDFEQKLIHWDNDPARLSLTNKIAKAMLTKTAPKGDELLLDYGTGTGLLALEFRPHVKKIVAVDLSEDMLAFLRKKLAAAAITGIEPLAWSIGDDPQELPRFDIIIVSLTLHHVMDTARAAGVLYSLLNPGGVIAVADFDPDNGESHGPGMAVHPGFVRADLMEIFRNAGFTGIQVEDVAALTKASSKTGMLREFPVFLMTARKAG
ncbi:MAG: class I SAM-dependent methyltransferase [Methanoregula sp.]|jgi:SAM-dependent methyltransferase